MKKLIHTLIALTCLGFFTCAARAEVAFKPVVVDMAKVFESHYKTEEANVKFTEFGKKVQEQLDSASKQLQEMATKYQELAEQSKNTLLKPEARAQAEADAQKKGEEIQDLQGTAQKFRNEKQNEIQQRFKALHDGLFEEIAIVVKNIAKSKGATLVLDKSSTPGSGLSTVIYSDDSYDITAEVIKEVNKDRPPAPPAPAVVVPAPAAAPAPAVVPAAAK